MNRQYLKTVVGERYMISDKEIDKIVTELRDVDPCDVDRVSQILNKYLPPKIAKEVSARYYFLFCKDVTSI